MSPTHKDKSFEKRLGWILKCAAVASFTLHHFIYIKGNTARYIAEVRSIYAPKKFPSGWSMQPLHLSKNTCYYLGTYPNYWNYTNKRIVAAHDLMTPDVSQMGNEPILYNKKALKESIGLREKMGIQGVPIREYLSDYEIKEMSSLEKEFGLIDLNKYLFPERMDRASQDAFFADPGGTGTKMDDAITKMGLFRDKSEIKDWLTQKLALDVNKGWFAACNEKYYPKPVKVPQYKTPAGDWPGTPMSEIQLPTPTAKPTSAPRYLKKVIKLKFEFKILKYKFQNGYILLLTVQELKG